MNIREHVPLGGYSTMRLGGIADFLTEVNSVVELKEAWEWAKAKNLTIIVVGEGSNIVWRDEGFPGLVIANHIPGFELRPFDETTARLTVGAGESWDSVVERTVTEGYYTLAPLSLIPGTAGATPVQNVGAYGQEISKCLMTLQAFDTTIGQLINLRASDCAFAYRTSRFKTSDKGRYIITAITLALSKLPLEKPYYESLQSYITENNLTVSSAEDIRRAVIAIRTSKLPDPKIVANNGSFFANPIVSDSVLAQLLDRENGLKYWPLGENQSKLSAAWLVENAGFKDVHDETTGMGTWAKQALVLVNEHAKSTADLLEFRDKIVTTVKEKFGVTLEQEPELLP